MRTKRDITSGRVWPFLLSQYTRRNTLIQHLVDRRKGRGLTARPAVAQLARWHRRSIRDEQE